MNFLIISVALIASLLGESHGQWGYQPAHWPTKFTGVNDLIPMAQQKAISNVHQVPCEYVDSLTPTTAAPVYSDPCVQKSAEQASKVALQNSHKLFNHENLNGYMFFFRNPNNIQIVQHQKPIAAPKIPDPCVEESVEIQEPTVNIQTPQVTFTQDDINRVKMFLNTFSSVMSTSTEPPKPTTVAPVVIVPCEDETHETKTTTETKATSKLTLSQDAMNSINSWIKSHVSTISASTEPPKPTTVAPEVPVPCEDETHKTQKTTVNKDVSSTAVTTSVDGYSKTSQANKSFKLIPAETTYTATSKQYTPSKSNGGVKKETTTSHTHTVDCDETKTASGGDIYVEETSTSAFPTRQTKVTEAHDEKTVKSVPTSVTTLTWGQFPEISAAVPHVYNWHKEQQSGSTYQKNSETHNLIIGAGTHQSQLATSQITFPTSFNLGISGQGNGVGQTNSKDVNTDQVITLPDGSALSIATLMEYLKKQKDC